MGIPGIGAIGDRCFGPTRDVVEGLDAVANAEEAGSEVQDQQWQLADLEVADRLSRPELVRGSNALAVGADQSACLGIVEAAAIASPAILGASHRAFQLDEDGVAAAL